MDGCRVKEEEESRRQTRMGSRRQWLDCMDRMPMKKKKMAGQLLVTNYS